VQGFDSCLLASLLQTHCLLSSRVIDNRYSANSDRLYNRIFIVSWNSCATADVFGKHSVCVCRQDPSVYDEAKLRW